MKDIIPVTYVIVCDMDRKKYQTNILSKTQDGIQFGKLRRELSLPSRSLLYIVIKGQHKY
jgi:hypothetical protein